MTIEHPKAKVAKLGINRFSQAEQKRNIWRVEPESGVTKDMLLNPLYWGHISAKLRMGDRIEVNPEDGSFYAELIVRHAQSGQASVAFLSFVVLDAVQELAPVGDGLDVNDYKVHFAGAAKWRVTRIADGQKVMEGLDNKDAAFDWLKGHVKAMAA